MYALALNIVSVVAATGAAIMWFWSASVRTPEQITSGWGGSGGTSQALGDAIRRQSKLSAIGAAFAGVSVLAQAGALVADMLRVQ